MFIYLHMRVISSPGCSIRSLHPVTVGCSTYGFFTLVFSVGVTDVGGSLSPTTLLFSEIVRDVCVLCELRVVVILSRIFSRLAL